MPRGANQKLKLLYLKDILENETDEAHPLGAPELIARLDALGVPAERKSVYDDLAVLCDYGLDIEHTREHGGGYYLASRDFELPELKLLVDAVQSSRFITAKKSGELIAKLERLAGRHGAGQLARQVSVAGRIKTMNESIYYSVDCIHAAIADDRQISFQYYDWDEHKRKRLRHGGRVYRVSPFALCWNDENYYLVAYDSASGAGRHYRVDKMTALSECEERREGSELFSSFDAAEYSRTMFGMYGGREELVTLLCKNALAGAVIDRFGQEITFFGQSGECFSVNVRVAVSPPFLTWIMNFGGDIRISAPDWVREEYFRVAAAATAEEKK